MGLEDILVKRINTEKANLENEIQKLKAVLTEKYDKLYSYGGRIEKLKKSIERIPKELNPTASGDSLYVTFPKVIAEDVKGKGHDIYLGDLKFKINFYNRNIRIVSGTYRAFGNSNNKFHPHQLGMDESAELCFGSLSSDVALALESFDLEKCIIYAQKFAKTYNSDDSAGRDYVGFPKAEFVVSEYHGKRILKNDSVFSNYHNSYLHKTEVVFSEKMKDHILEKDSIKIEGIGYVLKDSSDYLIIDGEYYSADHVTKTEDGRLIPNKYLVTTIDGVLENSKNCLILKGAYYHKDRIPKEILGDIVTEKIPLTYENAKVGMKVKPSEDFNYPISQLKGSEFGEIVEVINNKWVRIVWVSDESSKNCYKYINPDNDKPTLLIFAM